ncbi:hypothetical protein V5O48_014837 [Marasmius crinis-equi]|uniref:Uncharacterized protein n=1 Tax=Marasmius crinis-equi TaxID=585013 RepID=A0ABR3EW72_9AGAR
MSELSRSMHARNTSFLNRRSPLPRGRGSSSQGGGDNLTSASLETKLARSKWEFHEVFGQIVHMRNCDRALYYLCNRVSLSLPGTRGLAGKKRNLVDQLDGRKRAYQELQKKYDDLDHSYESARSELGDMTQEIARLSSLQDGNSERTGKKRRLDHTSNPGSSRIPSDAMIIDDEGGSGAVMAPNPNSAQSKKLSDDGAWDTPMTIGDAQYLIDVLRRSEDEGSPIFRAWNYLRKAHNKASRVDESKRNPFQQFIAKNYWIPDAFQRKKSDRVPTTTGTPTVTKAEKKKGKAKAEPTPAQPLTFPTPKPLPSVTPPRFSKDAPLDLMLACITQEVASETFRDGVVYNADGSISVRAVRGLHLLYGRSPSSQHGASPMHRHRYQLTFVEMVLTPGFYRAYIDANPSPTIVPSVKRYPADDANVNPTDLAEFFRRQAVPIVVVEDAALWAAHWLADVRYGDLESRLAVEELKRRLQAELIATGIPAGLNDDVYFPNGYIGERPSTIIREIPGLFSTPAQPTPGPSQPTPGPSQSSGAPPVAVTEESDHDMDLQAWELTTR